MAIPPRFLSELRDRLSLSDIVGKRVKLTRAGGREFKGCCPFHSEKTPSFTLNDDKQFYHCFGCGAHGDVIGFVMQHDNLTFIEAVEALAAQAGMQVPAQTSEDVEKAKEQKGLYALLEETSKWFERQLREPKYRPALEYMKGRGAGDDLMAQFRIGFAPDDPQALWQHLKKEGYSLDQMNEAGVVRPSTRGGNPYAFFRDRVMFPVADRRGRVVAFGGRILPDHLRASPDRGDGKPPKYINSSDSALFHKGRMLYGESHARQAAADGQPVIVVEGYLDVMACFEAGYRGAVAPLGTALTEEQILTLWKMIPAQSKMPVLCFDGDNAGRRAAARAAERLLPLLQPDQSAMIAFLPEGQDPDSLIRAQGPASLGAVLAGAKPLADFLWAHYAGARRLDTPEDRAGLEKTLEDEVLKIADRRVQQFYRTAFRGKMYELGRQEFASRGRAGKGRGQAPAPGAGSLPRRPAFKPGGLGGLILLAAAINHPGLFEQIEERLGTLDLGNERLDLLRQTILRILTADEGLDSEALQRHLKDRGFESELKAVLAEAVVTNAAFARQGAERQDVLDGWSQVFDLYREGVFLQNKSRRPGVPVFDPYERHRGKAGAATAAAGGDPADDVNKASEG